jgi:hypothetical protein
MPLASAVRGGTRPAQTVAWLREDGTPEDLSGAALSGFIRSRASGETRPVAGALNVADGPGGVLRWDYAADDVAEAGAFDVQFVASFASGQTPAKTFITRWEVRASLA